MDQKELYTEFWDLLSKTEDYLKYGKETKRDSKPEFTEQDPLEAEAQRPAAPVTQLAPGENCGHCAMFKSGRRAVPHLGSLQSDLWVFTDPPTLEAEKSGYPLGHDGMDYFQKWMSAIDLKLPEDLCLQNLTRCRTPGNRPPFQEEMNRCAKEVESRLEQHKPKVILALGPSCSAWFTSQRGMKVSAMRGKLYHWKGIPLMVSYSPEQVLNFGELKRPVWEDLKNLRNVLNGS